MSKKNRLNVLMIVFNNNIGGAEKRYVNLFKFLSKNSPLNQYRLAINKELFDLLNKGGCRLDQEDNVSIVGDKIVMREYFGLRSNNFGTSPKNWITYFETIQKKVVSEAHFFRNQQIFKSELTKIRESFKPDIVHGVLKAGIFLNDFKQMGVPTVSSYVSPQDFPEYQRELFKKVDAVDVLSGSMFKRISSMNILNQDRLYRAPRSFTDYNRVKVANKQKDIVYAGRFATCKHPEVFINMIKYIPENLKHDCKFIMIGEGYLLDDMRQLGKPYIESGLLEIRGYCDKPIEIFSKSMIFVQPTDCEEHATQSLLEAMACANAVVTTDLPGVEDVVPDGVGLRAELKAEAFAKAVSQLLSDIPALISMGQQAKTRVTTHFTVDGYGKYLERLYEDVLNKSI